MRVMDQILGSSSNPNPMNQPKIIWTCSLISSINSLHWELCQDSWRRDPSRSGAGVQQPAAGVSAPEQCLFLSSFPFFKLILLAKKFYHWSGDGRSRERGNSWVRQDDAPPFPWVAPPYKLQNVNTSVIQWESANCMFSHSDKRTVRKQWYCDLEKPGKTAFCQIFFSQGWFPGLSRWFKSSVIMLRSLQNIVSVFLHFSNAGMFISPYIFNICFLFTVDKWIDLIWLQYCTVTFLDKLYFPIFPQWQSHLMQFLILFLLS